MKTRRGKPPRLSSDDFPFAGLSENGGPGSFVEMVDDGFFDPDEGAMAEEEAGEEATVTPVVPPPVEAELDLHGCSCAEAKIRVENLLLTARLAGRRAVRIITGKGLHSSGPPVLPDFVEELVRRLRTAGAVRGFRWEQGDKARSGAIICYL